MRVLITDGNERSALAVTRALGQHQIQVVVGAERVHSLAASSKYCYQSFSYPSPYADSDGFVTRLQEVAQDLRVDMLFPMSDMAMLLIGRLRQRFEDFTRLPMPPLEIFEYLSDKYQLMQLAQATGIPIPKTIFVPSGDLEKVVNTLPDFPVVVKPGRSLANLNGRWTKTGVQYANSIEDLRRLYLHVDYLRHPSLIQNRVEGQGHGVFVLLDKGEPLALFAHRRLREKPPSGGVSVLRESIPLSQPMTEYALRLLQHVGWHGVAMVEFKLDQHSGMPLLMEVNGRFWGSVQLAIDAGVNFPYLLCQMAIGELRAPIPDTYRVGMKLRWLLGDLDHLLARLFKSKADLFLPPDTPSKVRAVLDFFRFYQRGMRYEVLQFHDPRPFIYELRAYVGHLLHPSPQLTPEVVRSTHALAG